MNTNGWTVYAALIVAGIFMLGAEIYLPGGILGVLGVLCLVGAGIAGFLIDTQFGFLSAALIVIASAIGLYLWVRVFPKTAAGRRLTLAADGRAFKAAPDETAVLTGREGVAETALRPAGIAMIDGRRIDVVTSGTWIDAGTRIRVEQVHGSRIEVVPARKEPTA